MADGQRGEHHHRGVRRAVAGVDRAFQPQDLRPRKTRTPAPFPTRRVPGAACRGDPRRRGPPCPPAPARNCPPPAPGAIVGAARDEHRDDHAVARGQERAGRGGGVVDAVHLQEHSAGRNNPRPSPCDHSRRVSSATSATSPAPAPPPPARNAPPATPPPGTRCPPRAAARAAPSTASWPAGNSGPTTRWRAASQTRGPGRARMATGAGGMGGAVRSDMGAGTVVQAPAMALPAA